MITINNLYKTFGDKVILNGINLEIKKGEIFGIAGRSGVGKSTLLRCINGLEKYDSGSLKVEGKEVSKLNDKDLRNFRKNVGMVFQSFSLINRATVYENIAFAMKIWGCSKTETDKRVKELLDVVGISEKIYENAKSLSGGQKQRVAIARALAMNPDILLCDEATSALDPKSTIDILNLLQYINKTFGITIIMVTHEMEVIKTLCDRMAIMANGVVEASGNVEEVFLNRPPALCNLLGEPHLDMNDNQIMLEIQKEDKNEDAFLLTKMVKDLSVDFVFVDSNKLSLKDKTLDSERIMINNSDKNQIEAYLTDKNVTFRFYGREVV